MSGCKQKENIKRQERTTKKSVLAPVHSIDTYASQELGSYALPEVCNRVRSMLDSDNCSMDEISKAIVFDPAVTTEILKLANSSLYNFRQKVDSLSKAATVLGGERIYSMLLSQFTVTAFNELHSKHLDMNRFWVGSFCTGFIARDLGKEDGLTKKEQEKLYLSGLMHNLGELAVAKMSPKTAILCEKLVKKGVHPWEAQKQQLGFTYSQCSALMLEKWGLPSNLYTPISDMAAVNILDQSHSARILNISANSALTETSENMFDINTILKAKFPELLPSNIEYIHSAKRNAIDHSISVVDLMDTFDASEHKSET